MSVAFTVDNGLVNVKILNQMGRKVFMCKGDFTLASKENYTLLITDDKYFLLSTDENSDGTPIPLTDMLGEVCKTNNVVKNIWIGENTNFYVVTVADVEENGVLIHTIDEISEKCEVTAPNYGINPVLAFADFDEEKDKAVIAIEEGEVAGIKINITEAIVPNSAIQNIVYMYDLVRVCDKGGDFTPPTHFTDITGAKRIIKTVSITTGNTDIYDPATQYKATSVYRYMLFIYPTENGNKYGNGTLVGNVLSGSVDVGSGIVRRDIDDLYREDEVERIVAAENAAGVQKIASKVFPKIGENGGNIYTILLKSSIDLSTAENLENMENVLKEAGIIGNTDSNNRTSLQLSGIGEIPPKFSLYYPTIKSTGKITLVKS